MQNNEEVVGTLGDLNQDVDVDCSPGRVGGGGAQNYNKLIFLPKAGDPALVGKILPDFNNGNKASFAVEYHEFPTGPRPEDKGFFFSPRCWGEQDELTKLFWDAVRERKTYSANKESAEYRKWDAIMKACRPKKGTICYWIGRGESKLQYLFLKEPAADVLFGAPAKKDAAGRDQPAIPGLIKEMREMGLSPFNLKDAAGWVKLYKTGAGPSTTFHAALDEIKVEEVLPNGRRKFSTTAAEAAVDPAILKLDPKKIVPLANIAKERGWSAEEIALFIDSDFTAVPERFLRRRGNARPPMTTRPASTGGEEVARAVENAYESGVEQATEEDLPF